MKSLSLILPVHNCAQKLRSNIQLLTELLPALTNEFQIIIVDDGSDDGTGDVVAELTDLYPQISAVFHAGRRGESTAIDNGLNLARHELKFVQATGTIEEGKIRSFLINEGALHANPPISAESEYTEIPEVSDPPSSHAHHEEVSAADVRLEHRLVERLMQWGSALRDYQQQAFPSVELAKSEEETRPTGSERSFVDKWSSMCEKGEVGLSTETELLEIQPLKESEQPEIPEPVVNQAIEAVKKVKARRRVSISPPKFSSIPELRLSRFAQIDKNRCAKNAV